MWYFSATVWLSGAVRPARRSYAARACPHPGMDFLASQGEFGLTRTVPSACPRAATRRTSPVFGYDPKIYYSGRSPLEAASMGIPLAPEDVTYRCNLVTLSDADNIENAVMIDYSADDISNEEAHELIAAIAAALCCGGLRACTAGFRYRHCLVLCAALGRGPHAAAQYHRKARGGPSSGGGEPRAPALADGALARNSP